MDQAAFEAMEAEVRAEVEHAFKFAEESPDPEPDDLLRDVLAP
jgi:TPP-dependent pyruvate/acetoin dehydrogenase alpha subunit